MAKIDEGGNLVNWHLRVNKQILSILKSFVKHVLVG